MKEIILSSMYIDKLYKFFFNRNKKILTSIIYMIVMYLVTFVYTVVFFVKINTVIDGFSNNNFTYSSFMLIMFIILIGFSVYLFVQYNKLQKETKFSFKDEISKTYPINSTEKISIEDNGIKSINSTQNHVFYFQYSDIACYYKYKNLYIFESKNDNFIIFEASKFDKELLLKIIKENKIKKKFVLTSFMNKKEF